MLTAVTGDRTSWPALDRLTDREHEVLRLMAHGLNNREIGETLHLSVATVKTHINRMFRKLAVRDRVEAVVIAYQSGVMVPGRNPRRAASDPS